MGLGNKLNICILSYRGNPNCGGQGVYIRYLSRELVKLGHSVDVISGEPYPILDDSVQLIKIPGIGVDVFNFKQFFPKQWWRLFQSLTDLIEWLETRSGVFAEPKAFGKRAYKYIKKNKLSYDIIHDNQTLSKKSLAFQDKFPGFLSTIHHPITKDFEFSMQQVTTSTQAFGLKRWYRFLRMQSSVASQLKHILTVSKQSKQDIQTDFNVQSSAITVIPIGIDTTLFKKNKAIKKESFHLLSFANSKQPLKGLLFLIQAFDKKIKQIPELKLTLIMQKNKKSKELQLIKDLGLDSAINIKHELSNSEIIDEYSKATAVVIPSLYEGFGIPALEALACETPVLGTSVGALPEVVSKFGIIVEPRCVKSLSKGIEIIIKKRDEFNKKMIEARQHVKENYSWVTVSSQTLAYYRKVMAFDNH